jgi:hypothetical protein
MDAVAALYAGGNPETAEAIVASLSNAVFHSGEIKPAGGIKRALARASYRLLRWTTKAHLVTDDSGAEVAIFRNRLLERSRHPYASSLLTSSRSETVTLVEGGDPMNGPYMMLAPEIRKNCGSWDRLFFDSVQGKDVQSRFIWETRSTYEAAKARLTKDEAVRLKSVAAGTGLSMILAYDKLIRDGFDPALITARITDREDANIAKATRLLSKLSTTRNRIGSNPDVHGISAGTEDIFPTHGQRNATSGAQYDVVTAIGILEYFQGSSYDTTEQRLRMEPSVDSVTAHDLAERLKEMTTSRANLIVNTYLDHASTRILELFGKRFDYRNRENLRALLASVDFHPARLMGSGHIYDVEIYEKGPLSP